MQINCPNCNQVVEQHRPPGRGDSNAGEAWVCIKCPSVICVHCYTVHNQKDHPEVYNLKSQPSGGGKKNSKGKKR